MPVVAVIGPRQSGKTTLVRRLASDRAYISFDDDPTVRAAALDPGRFVEALPRRVTLDEIQRVPQLLPAIKRSVDRDREPGRFLLTGSANLLLLPRVTESLAGRMAIADLQPLTEAEKEGCPGQFLKLLLDGAIRPRVGGGPTGASPSLEDRIVGGWLPLCAPVDPRHDPGVAPASTCGPSSNGTSGTWPESGTRENSGGCWRCSRIGRAGSSAPPAWRATWTSTGARCGALRERSGTALPRSAPAGLAPQPRPAPHPFAESASRGQRPRHDARRADGPRPGWQPGPAGTPAGVLCRPATDRPGRLDRSRSRVLALPGQGPGGSGFGDDRRRPHLGVRDQGRLVTVGRRWPRPRPPRGPLREALRRRSALPHRRGHPPAG